MTIAAVPAEGTSAQDVVDVVDDVDVIDQATKDAAAAERAAAAADGARAAQCTGGGFEPRPGDAAAAARLMAGELRMSPHRAVALPANPRWNEDRGRDPNWGFQYHTLRWADVLRREGLRTNDQAMIDRYTFLLRDWLADNPRNAPRSRFAYFDMAVGKRAIGYVCAYESFGAPTWARNGVALHGRVLANEYTGRGNHALHQNVGLLAAGCATGTAAWRNLAVDRTATLLARSVDTQGVNDEGSVGYHYSNYSWYSGVKRRIESCGLTPEGPFDRLRKMPTFLMHATKPDGRYVGIGDSDPQSAAVAIPGTFAEYAATRGAQGPRPSSTFRIYGAGYAFSRSGWGVDRPFEAESHVSLRYGPPRPAGHGHDDTGSVTLFARGADHVWEQGRYRYSSHPFRKYVVSRAAHNVVDIPSATYARTASAPLLAYEHAAGHDLVSIRSRKLSGAVWTRTALHIKGPGILVVDDRISQSTSRRVVQRWHLGADRRVLRGTGRVWTTGSGSNATFLWVSGAPTLRVAKGRRDPIMGWRSMRYGHIQAVPAIEAAKAGRTVRFTTIVVPRAAAVDPATIRIRNARTSASVVTFDLVIGRQVYRVRLTVTYARVRRIA